MVGGSALRGCGCVEDLKQDSTNPFETLKVSAGIIKSICNQTESHWRDAKTPVTWSCFSVAVMTSALICIPSLKYHKGLLSTLKYQLQGCWEARRLQSWSYSPPAALPRSAFSCIYDQLQRFQPHLLCNCFSTHVYFNLHWNNIISLGGLIEDYSIQLNACQSATSAVYAVPGCVV